MIDIYESDRESRLLPWESTEAFERFRREFHAERAPKGPIETALVDRLVWIEWRRKRLRLAERALHLGALAERLDNGDHTMARAGLRARVARERLDLDDVVASDPATDSKVAAEHRVDREATAKALVLLDRGGEHAYQRALALLHPDTRGWWEDGLAGEYGDERAWSPDANTLASFLREDVGPADEATALADRARSAVRLQAFGESLDPDRIDRLLAIDARLDRQFEKALSTLIQLQGMRRRTPPRLSGGAVRAGAASRG
jgi:hypothetical protein